MKKLQLLLSAVALALLAVPSTASAQDTETLIRTGNGYGVTLGTNRGTVYASPYQGRFAGDPTNANIDMFCIDFMHNASPRNVGYTVALTSIGSGDLSSTRFGGLPNGLAKYQQAAWLISHYSTATDNEWRAIQMAIWKVFTPTAYATNGAIEAAAQGWLSTAQTAYDDGGSTYSSFVVLTGQGQGAEYQEFIMVTPEPETYALMATGLLFLFLAWRRRRQHGDDLLPMGGTGF